MGVCSEVIRTEFGRCDAFHYRGRGGKGKKRFVFAENDFSAHAMIVQSDGERVKCYLDGRLVCDESLHALVGDRSKDEKVYATRMLVGDEDGEEMLLAHKAGKKEGMAHGLFHGYLFGLALHSGSFA